MNVTEVRVCLVNSADEQLLAFCIVTFDRAFVVRDIRIINGTNGPFVAMPSRRATTNCDSCGTKNYLGSKFCAECGARMPPVSQLKLPERSRGFIDIAHPINAKSREKIQSAILEAYQRELTASRLPEYRPDPLEPDAGENNNPGNPGKPAKPPHWQPDRKPKQDKEDET